MRYASDGTKLYPGPKPGRIEVSVTMRGAIPAILVLGLCGVSSAQKLRFTAVRKDVVLERVAHAPVTNEQRQARIKELFTRAGCSGAALVEQQVAGADTPNIICRLSGAGDETIVVGAVYGQDPGSTPAQNTIDSWSAATLLASLYQSLSGEKRNHTMLFIAFSDSGSSEAGPAFYAEHMTEGQARQTEAVLHLSALGLSPTKVCTSRSDKDLVRSLVVVTYLLKLPLSQVEGQDSSPAAAASFTARQIPQITVHSLTKEDVTGGRTAAFRPANYLDTYLLLSGYLAYLDATLKPRIAAK
jgi:hypothetical protein